MRFLAPVLLLFLLRYLWVRLRPFFPVRFRLAGAAGFIFCISTVFLYRLLPPSGEWLGTLLVAWGSFFLVFLGNWLAACLLFDLGLGVRRLFFAATRRQHQATRLRWQPRLAATILGITVLFYLYGVPNQLNFTITRVDVSAERPLDKPLRFVMLSDIHFDLLFPRSKMVALVDSLHALQPDAVLFAGDLADIPASALNERGLDSLLRQIQPPMGFFGVTGNHEAYMNPHGQTIEWMQENGIQLLQDTTICQPQFCITGRSDYHYANRNGLARKPLTQLTPTGEFAKVPWLVLDHQPKGLDVLDIRRDHKPSLVLSGHTHAGQYFPWNMIIHLLWKVPVGLGRIDDVPWLVSSGFGQWGPPIRVGTQSEIILLTIH